MKKTIRLTEEETAMAKKLEMNPVEYHKYKLSVRATQAELIESFQKHKELWLAFGFNPVSGHALDVTHKASK